MIEATASEVVAAYLISKVGLFIGRPYLTPTWPVTKGAMPVDWTTKISNLGDNWISILDLTPKSEGKYMSCTPDHSVVDGESVVKPVVQILVRSLDYDTASVQIRRISCSLSPVHRVIVTCLGDEDVLFHACCIEQQPAFLYQEEKSRRQVFVMVAKLSISGVN